MGIRAAGVWQVSEKCPNRSAEIVRAKFGLNAANAKGEVLAGVKGPRVGPSSDFGGHGNQRAWASGVGRLHSGESPKGYDSNAGLQALAAWARVFVAGNRLNARTPTYLTCAAHRPRFLVGKNDMIRSSVKPMSKTVSDTVEPPFPVKAES